MSLDILSLISFIVTVILGGGAIYQSWRYNKDAEKISSDTKYMLVNQIRLLNEMEKKFKKENENGVIDMSKDELILHKLSTFNEKDIENIMKEVRQLTIKRVFIDKINDFLKSNKIDYKCSFVNKANVDGNFTISQLYTILLKYNVLVEIR